MPSNCAQSQIACLPFDQSFKRKQKIFFGPLTGDPLCPCRLNEINLALRGLMQNFILRRLQTTGAPPCKHTAGAQSDDESQKIRINGNRDKFIY